MAVVPVIWLVQRGVPAGCLHIHREEPGITWFSGHVCLRLTLCGLSRENWSVPFWRTARDWERRPRSIHTAESLDRAPDMPRCRHCASLAADYGYDAAAFLGGAQVGAEAVALVRRLAQIRRRLEQDGELVTEMVRIEGALQLLRRPDHTEEAMEQ